MIGIKVQIFFEREIGLKSRKMLEVKMDTRGLSRKLFFAPNTYPYPFPTAPCTEEEVGVSDTLLPRGVFILGLLVVNFISLTQECKRNTALAKSAAFLH